MWESRVDGWKVEQWKKLTNRLKPYNSSLWDSYKFRVRDINHDLSGEEGILEQISFVYAIFLSDHNVFK